MDLKQKVIDACAAAVVEGGLDALSLREVARRAGVSHQAPYHHFRDREGILAAVAEQGFTRLTAALQAAATGDPLARAEATGVAYVTFARDHPGHFRVMFRRDAVPYDAHPELARSAESAFAELRAMVDAVHEAGYAPHVGADALVWLLWSSVHGLATLALEGPAPRDGFDPGPLVVAALTSLLRASAGPSDPSNQHPRLDAAQAG